MFTCLRALTGNSWLLLLSFAVIHLSLGNSGKTTTGFYAFSLELFTDFPVSAAHRHYTLKSHQYLASKFNSRKSYAYLLTVKHILAGNAFSGEWRINKSVCPYVVCVCAYVTALIVVASWAFSDNLMYLACSIACV